MMPEKLNIAVTCASGVEKAVKSELKRLGYGDVPADNGTLSFSADALAVARCNLFLRSADRVYIKVKEFTARTFDELFDQTKETDWENYLPKDAKILVNGKSVKSTLFAISACQSIVNKAIVDRLIDSYKATRLMENGPTYKVEFSIYKDQVRLYINTSGEGLHKRGYRDLVGIAPIRETLASAMILMSDYYYQRPFADPFCGSGTIAIECAKIALNIAGGKGRRFAFNDWPNFSDKYFDLAMEEALDNERRNFKPEIFASDVDLKAIKLAKRHAERAGVLDKIKFSVSDVKDFKNSLSFGTIVTNPPYGERVYDLKQAEECYKSLGRAFLELDKWSCFVITSAKSFERHFGKKADRERKLFNSNKECRLYYYYSKKGEANADKEY